MKQSRDCSIERAVAQNSPAGFAWAATGGEWQIAPHLHLLSDKLRAVAEGKKRRLMVFMPPRHGKSELTSRFFPAWLVMKYRRRVMLASYEATFARWWGLQARELVREYGPMWFDCSISKLLDQQAWWGLAGLETKAAMMTAGVGGPVTGKGGDVLIVDDPVKNAEEADSALMRERNWQWWTKTWRTRGQKGSSFIVVMTRWHEDDLAGRILNSPTKGEQEWDVIDLPALADQEEQLLLSGGMRFGRTEGDPLWTDMFDRRELDLIRAETDDRTWFALYQQKPMPDGGTIWKREWFDQRYDAGAVEAQRKAGTLRTKQRLVKLIQLADCANKTGVKNDFSVIATWGKRVSGEMLLLDVWRGRVEFDDLKMGAYDAWAKWRPDMLWIEDAVNGTALYQELRRKPKPQELRKMGRTQIQRVLVSEWRPNGSKIARAESVTPMAKNGLVELPDEAEWLSDWIEEHVRFPTGTHDDQVDTTSMALDILRDMPSRVMITR